MYKQDISGRSRFGAKAFDKLPTLGNVSGSCTHKYYICLNSRIGDVSEGQINARVGND